MQAIQKIQDEPAGEHVTDPLTADQRAEIEEIRATGRETLRPTVPALEEILYQPLTVLDRGFVRVVDYMGDDGAIVQAARVSYGRGTKKVREDRGLIRYLMRHRHTTPFEMCEIKYHVKLPVFVARQWIRHRTANVNEYSARYSILEDEFYMPAPEHLARQSKSNRQGRGDVLALADAQRVLDLLRADAARSYANYQEMMQAHDLARELARMNLTLNVFTQWYWKIDLHNLLHFLSLRGDAHAQYEIRAYADAMAETVKRWVPNAFEAFDDYVVGGGHLSRAGLAVVRRMIAGEDVTQENSGMSPREWRELQALLDLDQETGAGPAPAWGQQPAG